MGAIFNAIIINLKQKIYYEKQTYIFYVFPNELCLGGFAHKQSRVLESYNSFLFRQSATEKI